jgi:hypothetical protein
VVHHQIHRHEGFDHFGVLAHLVGDAAHRREVGEQGHAGEILQHDAGEHERDLVGARGVRLPAGELLDVFLGDLLAVAIPEHRFEHDADRYRQARDPAQAGLFQRGQGVELAGLAGGEFEVLKCAVQVMRH